MSDAAHDAKAEAKDNDENVGAAVSTAVCEVLQDEQNLPEPARDAPGHAHDRDCKHPSEAEDDESVAEKDDSDEQAAAEHQSEHQGDTHGAAVSQAAHEAKEQAKADGVKVGPAVSEAVCRVNQDKQDLPLGAQSAPGHNKDCIHPSNVETATLEIEAESQSRGKEFAPGQLKKQKD